jgi:hypothetical protein
LQLLYLLRQAGHTAAQLLDVCNAWRLYLLRLVLLVAALLVKQGVLQAGESIQVCRTNLLEPKLCGIEKQKLPV